MDFDFFIKMEEKRIDPEAIRKRAGETGASRQLATCSPARRKEVSLLDFLGGRCKEAAKEVKGYFPGGEPRRDEAALEAAIKGLAEAEARTELKDTLPAVVKGLDAAVEAVYMALDEPVTDDVQALMYSLAPVYIIIREPEERRLLKNQTALLAQYHLVYNSYSQRLFFGSGEGAGIEERIEEGMKADALKKLAAACVKAQNAPGLNKSVIIDAGAVNQYLAALTKQLS